MIKLHYILKMLLTFDIKNHFLFLSLNGVERTADKIAQWIRSEFQKKISSRLNGAKLPITSLVSKEHKIAKKLYD